MLCSCMCIEFHIDWDVLKECAWHVHSLCTSEFHFVHAKTYSFVCMQSFSLKSIQLFVHEAQALKILTEEDEMNNSFSSFQKLCDKKGTELWPQRHETLRHFIVFFV